MVYIHSGAQGSFQLEPHHPAAKSQWYRSLQVTTNWSLLRRGTTKKLGDFTLKSLLLETIAPSTASRGQ